MRPWGYGIYYTKTSNVKFMRVKIRAAIGIRNICIGYILSENRACKLCHDVF